MYFTFVHPCIQDVIVYVIYIHISMVLDKVFIALILALLKSGEIGGLLLAL